MPPQAAPHQPVPPVQTWVPSQVPPAKPKQKRRWVAPTIAAIIALFVGYSAAQREVEQLEANVSALEAENADLKDQLSAMDTDLSGLRGRFGAPSDNTELPGTGEYLVGLDMVEGTYQSEGGLGCTWVRMPVDGTAPEIGEGAGTVTITGNDLIFITNGCEPWMLQDG